MGGSCGGGGEVVVAEEEENKVRWKCEFQEIQIERIFWLLVDGKYGR